MKTIRKVEWLARQHTENAINILVGIMNEPSIEARSRVAAANAILDRAWGRATQRHELGEGDGPKLLKIVREIVHVERPEQRPVEIARMEPPAAEELVVDYKDVSNGNGHDRQ